ncbi:acid protease [Zopfia rhizophila CBS 207.26]|uniref:Acid protease n=1 Tax=Zopfia rhizophila CBS 207.26 TaxID=1314779 RepID=A0A6A6DLG5_9PEZI|nr:acid protease [Zopfia rhizophila CBS 207.26]
MAFLGVVGAAPVEELQKRNTFTISQVESTKFVRNGPASIVKTFRKYGKAPPAALIMAAAASPNGTVSATPLDAYDTEYVSQIDVGGTTMNMVLDTGSADLWVFSSLQPSSQTSGHNIYKADSSKKVSGATWEIVYGDGSEASGAVYSDKVVVGGMTATSQAVEAATSVSSQLQVEKAIDGIFGLAFSSISSVEPNKVKTFFDNVKPSLAFPLFAVTLKYHAPGTYDFGFIDKSKYTGNITYVDVNTTQGAWEFTASGYAVGSGSTTTTNINAVIDTGATLLYLPTAVVKAYYAKVPKAQVSRTEGGYIFPCSTTLPDFTVIIGGSKQVVPGKYINYAPTKTDPTTCFGGIQKVGDIGVSIFGDIFLKSKYVIHEAGSGTPRLGFAQQVGV